MVLEMLGRAAGFLTKPAGVLAHAFHQRPDGWRVAWSGPSKTLVFTKTVFGNRMSFNWKTGDSERRVLSVHRGATAEQVVAGICSFFGITHAQVAMLLVACDSVWGDGETDIPEHAMETIMLAREIANTPGVVEHALGLVPASEIGVVEAIIGSRLTARAIPWFAPLVATEPERACRALGQASKTEMTGDLMFWLAAYGASVAGRSHISPRTASMYLGMVKNLLASYNEMGGAGDAELLEIIMPMISGDSRAKQRFVGAVLARATTGSRHELHGLRLACRELPDVSLMLDKTARFMAMFGSK